MPVNSLGQPVGESLPQWQAPPPPPRVALQGNWCRVEPLDPARHADSMWLADSQERDAASWTYLSVGPFAAASEHRAWLEKLASSADPMAFAIIDPTQQRAVGVCSYLRIAPEHGVIEIGHIHYSPALQRTTAATEAMYLLMAQAFALGYRRYEWKCDSLNAASRAAAERLGFTYEGTFRQAIVYKGRSRDTAWFAIVDRDWPVLKRAFERWLASANFTADGRQIRSLVGCRGG
jgi:RimJ/RimL family protein N-acetyltransferase